MTTPKERMSEEQLRWAREGLADPLPYSNESARDEISRLLNHIDALRAARTVEDGEVAEFVQWLLLEADQPGRDAGTSWRFNKTADLLRRLSAARAEAERERDEARAALAQAREAALEEAAKKIDELIFFSGGKAARDMGYREGCRAAQRDIRALKTTPTQESETP